MFCSTIDLHETLVRVDPQNLCDFPVAFGQEARRRRRDGTEQGDVVESIFCRNKVKIPCVDSGGKGLGEWNDCLTLSIIEISAERTH